MTVQPDWIRFQEKIEIQKREREEDERVARYKMERDQQQIPFVFPVPGLDDGRARSELKSDDIVRFACAGNAIFTVSNSETSNRFTYRIRIALDKQTGKPQVGGPWFVAVLTGQDNNSDYRFIGTLFTRPTLPVFVRGRKSSISESAQSVQVFKWFWERLAGPGLPDCIQVHHEGRCGRCGRRLTVPESIERGLGPDCAGKVA